jgi:DMSO/TMAO reductase YedYZ molybdopterin-dependent catalytic subunit
MKKVTFLAAIALLGFTAVDANAQATQAAQQAQEQTDKREKVTKEQLPEPVKAVLDHEAYKEWTVGDIYKVKPAEGAANAKVLYEISLTNKEGQTGTITLDETGKDASSKEE